jgi:hypothetical protein
VGELDFWAANDFVKIGKLLFSCTLATGILPSRCRLSIEHAVLVPVFWVRPEFSSSAPVMAVKVLATFSYDPERQ